MYALDNPYGSHCAQDGFAVSGVWARYPPKRVPDVVGDKYDRWPLAKDYPWADEVSAEVCERARRLRLRNQARRLRKQDRQ